MQLFEFQQLNQLITKSTETIYVNHHPKVAGNFIYQVQMNQILRHSNLKIIRHFYIICRIYAQDIENSISLRLKSKRYTIMTSLRELGYVANMLTHYTSAPFPTFSKQILFQHQNYLKEHIPNLDLSRKNIAVHSRSGNFPKFKEPERVKSGFRNTLFSEINSISEHFDTDNFNFIRIGHYEEFDRLTSNRITDLRNQINLDPVLQLAVFTSIAGYVGSSSGPLSFFAMQNLPCLLISVYPIDTGYSENPRSQMVIPKLIWDIEKQRYLSIHEQFNKKLIDLQNYYNDTLLIEKKLEPHSLPVSITSQIYVNWQSSVLISNTPTKWINSSVSASLKLSEDLNLPNLPIIPIEYFDYLDSINL
jgi:putative glycosyltransferase (TIGR04372 family)